MSNAVKVAVEKYPHGKFDGWLGDSLRAACSIGYNQAEKDIIALIESRLSELLGDAQPTPILRYELRDLIKKIKEEQVMKLIWHHNTWPWGKTIRIIKSDGSAIVEMSFEGNQPGVCFLSGLSVIEPQRRKGIATHLMLACESYCRENGIFRIDLNSVLTDWVQDFHKKCGYIPLKEENGFMQMYKLLEKI